MTAILAIRVNDGVVLAGDGRSLIRRNRDGEALAAFDQAGKVFPIGAQPAVGFASCGGGSVGGLTLRFLAGELLAGGGGAGGIRAALARAAELIERRSDTPVCPAHNPRPDITWLVGGYEGDEPLPSLWRFAVRHGRPQVPERIERNLVWDGDGTAALDRLIGGAAPELFGVIRGETDGPTADRLAQVIDRLRLDLVHPEMPLGDAVALARLLLETAIGIERLRNAAPLAGGDLAIAVIDRQRGFRYICGEPL